jgi:glutamate---cysteine ligase / carboxylate-amine ligase
LTHPEAPAYRLFERFGIEIEYMIVDRTSLAVRPLADKLITTAAGSLRNEIDRGATGWSNELALHVIEIKTNGPVASLDGVAAVFLDSARQAAALLRPFDALLLESGMHPFMDPTRETVLWPHGLSDIYQTFDRIFSCKGHGWSNVQSVHVNLPFSNDKEFGRLLAAIRFVLPIIPALAASSPLAEGRPTGFLDTRMEAYRSNSARVPSITGDVIPEPIFTIKEYREKTLEPIYRDLSPLDPAKTLQEEWVNARGAIARFERNTIEIRIIDAQETPEADLAVAAAVIGAVKLMADERFAPLREQQKWPVAPLKKILLDTIKHGETASITDEAYLRALGLTCGASTGRDVWEHLLAALDAHEPALITAHRSALDRILARGTLATRILAALGDVISVDKITEVYRTLGDCLLEGNLF